MKLPEEFIFLNGGEDIPVYQRGKTINKKKFYCYDRKNTKRTNILLWGEIFNKRTIYKYIDRRKFKDYVKDEGGFTICFQEPSEWKDPYESRFYKANFSKMFRNLDFVKGNHKLLYACCFALHKDSEPSWKMYVDDKLDNDRKVCIQLKINFKALLDYLNYYINKKLGGAYMLVAGPVTYKEKSEINKLHRCDEEGKLNNFFNDFNFTKYLELLMIKRKAFIYEDEIRLFLIPKKNGYVRHKKLIIHIPAQCPDDVKSSEKWGDIVDALFLDPVSKKEELEAYKDFFKDKNIGISKEKFSISNLYDTCSNIVIGETKEEEMRRKKKEGKRKKKKVVRKSRKNRPILRECSRIKL